MTQPFSHHVFVCTQQQHEDKTYCTNLGSEEVRVALQREIASRHLERVELTPCGCLGLCGRGPVIVVYPEGVWYAGVKVTDVAEIVEHHFVGGRPVERLRVDAGPETMRAEILAEKRHGRDLELAEERAGVLPERLRRLANDFQASRAFLTAVELDAFSAVGEGAGAAEAAERMGTDPRATEMLLNALSALALLTKQDGVYRCTPDTGRYLRRGVADDSRAAVMNRVHMWDNWSTLTECVREGSSQRHEVGPSVTQAYLAATHRIAALAAPGIVSALALPRVTRVLDVGGGSGAHTVAFLRAYPGSTAVLMDLPHVIRVTPRYTREAGCEDRITLRPGDFMVDPLGSGFDLALLSYVLHLNPPEANKRLLSRVHAALEPGGRIVVNDFVLNREKTLPRNAALHSLQMLVASQSGSAYSFDEFKGWLEAAGFADVAKVTLIGPTDVVTARKG